MVWPQSLSTQLSNNATFPNDVNLAMPTQNFQPSPQTNPSYWYGSNQYKPTPSRPMSSQKPNYQKMIYLSPDPGTHRPSGRYFAILSSRTGTRVETALDVRLVLADPPPGLSRIRVHEEHVTKVKYLKDAHLPLTARASCNGFLC